MRSPLKLLCLILCFLLSLSFVACKEETPAEVPSSEPTSSESAPEPEPVKLNVNPLTGLETLTDEEVGFRPVAVAINNVGVAQSIQSGMESADIVFETLTEAGITRLLALYKAPNEKIGNIGSIRSARTVFAELAASMNAVYVHHGQDDYHFPARAKALKLPLLVINPQSNGERIKNGKAYEHTLYTSGAKLRGELERLGYDKGYESDNWVNFVENKSQAVDLANSVTVKFNSTSVSTFTYDPATKSYTRGAKGRALTNYFNGKSAAFTNVFVLYTSVAPYGSTHGNGSSCTHTKVDLKSGNGYYITGGGYEKITWSKSGTNTPIKFKNSEGNSLEVAAGNSFVCIVGKNAADSFTVQ